MGKKLLLFFMPLLLIAGPSQLFFGLKITYVELKFDAEPNLVFSAGDQDFTIDGVFGGVEFGYLYKKFQGAYAFLGGNYLDGSFSNSPHPSRNTWQVQAETRVGYNYVARQGLSVIATPYLGLGFLYDHQDRKSFGAVASTTFAYYKIYLPVGCIIDYKVYERMHVGLHFQWRPDLDSTLRISSLPNERYILHRENDQLLVEVPFDFYVGDCLDWKISLVPFWQKIKEGATLNQTTLALPEQTLTYWGVNILGAYQF